MSKGLGFSVWGFGLRVFKIRDAGLRVQNCMALGFRFIAIPIVWLLVFGSGVEGYDIGSMLDGFGCEETGSNRTISGAGRRGETGRPCARCMLRRRSP